MLDGFFFTLWFVVTSGFLPGSKPKNVNAPVRRIDYPGKVRHSSAFLDCSGVAVPLTTSFDIIQLWLLETFSSILSYIINIFAVEVIAGIIMTAIIIVYLFHHFKWAKWVMLVKVKVLRQDNFFIVI